MTMLSFRVDADEARRAQQWADALGIDKSELLREALHRHLVGLASAHDVSAWEREPLGASESALASVADWGPAEDWADWADATR